MTEIAVSQSSAFSFDEIAHRYFFGGEKIPGVTEVLNSCGLISNFGKDEGARRRGQIVHKAMALFGRGALDFSTVDPRILGFVLSGITFHKELAFRPYDDGVEVPSYHPDYLYGYTIDAVGDSNRGKILIDYKTGKAPKIATALQLAAYQEGARQKWGIRFRTIAVELARDGGIPNLVFLGNERNDFADFICCLNVVRLRGRA